jgi:hypothetical protein
VWDLTASACSCELVPEIGTAVRSLTVALDGTMIVAANNHGTCYVWRMMRGNLSAADDCATAPTPVPLPAVACTHYAVLGQS